MTNGVVLQSDRNESEPLAGRGELLPAVHPAVDLVNEGTGVPQTVPVYGRPERQFAAGPLKR
jgi:hypothetical protein